MSENKWVVNASGLYQCSVHAENGYVYLFWTFPLIIKSFLYFFYSRRWVFEIWLYSLMMIGMFQWHIKEYVCFLGHRSQSLCKDVATCGKWKKALAEGCRSVILVDLNITVSRGLSWSTHNDPDLLYALLWCVFNDNLAPVCFYVSIIKLFSFFFTSNNGLNVYFSSLSINTCVFVPSAQCGIDFPEILMLEWTK